MTSPTIKYFLDKIDPRYSFILVDAGAMGGIPKKWDVLGQRLNVIAFEPDEREFQKLQDT